METVNSNISMYGHLRGLNNMSDTNKYDALELAKRISAYAKQNKILTSRMLEACNLGVNTLSHMRHGKKCSYETIAKMADYLDCSVDFLLGRTDEPSSHKISKGTTAKIIELHKLGTMENGKKLIFTAAYSTDNVKAEYIEIDSDEFEAMKASADNDNLDD